MSELPHVMRDIVSPLVLGNEDKWWLKPKYLRRGRLVEAAVTLLANRQIIEPSWWLRHSGESEDDRVEHLECEPYVIGGQKFLMEVPCQLIAVQREVISRDYDYQGHIDWQALLHRGPADYVIDLKCGEPPAKGSPLDWAYRMQLALYVIALAEERKQSTSAYRRADLHLFDGTYKLIERGGLYDIRAARILLDYYALSREWSKP